MVECFYITWSTSRKVDVLFWSTDSRLSVDNGVHQLCLRLSVAIRPPTVCLTLPVWFPRQQSRGCFLRRSSPQGCMKYFWLYFGERDSRPVEKQKRQNRQSLTEMETQSLTSDQLPSSPILLIKISSSILREETPQRNQKESTEKIRSVVSSLSRPCVRTGDSQLLSPAEVISTLWGVRQEAGMCVQKHLWRNQTVILYINTFRHRHKSHSGFLSMQLKNEA